MADTYQVLNLAAIIREVDGSNNKGAAALAESILDHPRFRAVLAGEPAEPPLYARQTGIGQWEGADHPSGPWRKVLPADLARWGNPAPQPAAVTGQFTSPAEGPTNDEVEVLADQLGLIRGHANHPCGFWIDDGDAGALVRAALARWGNPVPAPPANGEVAELVAWLQEEADDYDCIGCEDSAAKCNRTAELLERLSPPQPVPVSERLPGPKDCDAIGCCWWYSASHGWELYHRENGLGTSTHWLPAHALPVPEVSE